jgi:integrase/recombinase XerC
MSCSELSDYVFYLRDRGLARSTRNRYRSIIQSLLEYLEVEDGSLSQITAAQIQEYIAHLQERDLTRNTIAEHLQVSRRFFAFLLEKGTIKKGPTKATPHIKKKYPCEFRALSVPEVEAFFEVFQYYDEDEERQWRDEVIFHLIYACGLRTGEVVRVKVQDIDFDSATLRVEAFKGNERAIHLRADTLALLREYVTETEPEAYLFPGGGGGHLTTGTVARRMKKYLDLAGLPQDISPRVLRSSMAAHYLQGDAPIGFVQERLGHTAVEYTARYGKFMTEKEEEKEDAIPPPPVVVE